MIVGVLFLVSLLTVEFYWWLTDLAVAHLVDLQSQSVFRAQLDPVYYLVSSPCAEL